MQNPILNEIEFVAGEERMMEFNQVWKTVSIDPLKGAMPCIRNQWFHLVCISGLILGSLIALVLGPKPRWQYVVFLLTVAASVSLFLSVLIQFRWRVKELGSAVILAVETPHYLWFVLLFTFQIFAFSTLYEGVKSMDKD